MSRGRPRKMTPAEQHEIRRYREAGVSIARLAAMWKVSSATIFRILAEQRTKFGLEQFPKKQLARAHLFKQLASAPSDTSQNSPSGSTQT